MNLKLIMALVSDEKTDAVIDAARDAGATGATVITSVRGEGLKPDKTFLGLDLTAQRDVLLFLVAEQRAREILETIAKAGGVNISEAGKNIIVLRQSGDKKKDVKRITVNLNRLLKEGDLSLNLALRDKDTVFIPEADQIFVFGEVNSPGPYDLTEENFSVVEAISKAGGLTKLAAANRTRIVRVEGGEEFAIEVDVEKIMEGDRSQDQFLKPGDIIVIPEVYF